MRLTYSSVLQWLAANAETLTPAEIAKLETAVANAKAESHRHNEKLQRALAEMESIAKSVGLGSATDLLKLVARGPAAAAPDGKTPRAGLRKPYMDPYDPDSGIFALTHLHELPEWARRAVANGWTKPEFHYKRIGAAWKARGITPAYDPIARHKELMHKELDETVVYQRGK